MSIAIAHPRHRRSRSTRTGLLLALATVTALVLGGAWLVTGSAARPTAETGSGQDPGTTTPTSAGGHDPGAGTGGSASYSPSAGSGAVAETLGVLREWDSRRADAYAAGDPVALRSLYVRGSPAGAADVAVLQKYLERGLRVEGMRVQVLAATVLSRSERRLRIRVTDRITGATAVGTRTQVRLPRDAASTRTIVLVRHRGGSLWRVASVRE